jgi:23S rRNA (adenine2503-C2)-methyltransferase
LTRRELEEELGSFIDRPFRVEQLYGALYQRGARDFYQITDLSVELRRCLASRYRIGWPTIEARAEAEDQAVKYLLRLEDGAALEVVDIPEKGRRTLCLSTQTGCALGCRFCATGHGGAGRDLTSGEIVAQVLALCGRLLASDSLNLVLMGMGEPLLNLDNVRRALEILGEWVSWRRMTVSTAGLVPGIRSLAEWPRRPNLAISLHAPDEERRRALMPIAAKHPLPELLDALRSFPLEPGRRLTIEYLLIAGLNDAPADADAVSRLLEGIRCKVNLIPVNPDPVLESRMVPPSDGVVARFRERLQRRGLVATVRRRRGGDAGAACGQLRSVSR